MASTIGQSFSIKVLQYLVKKTRDYGNEQDLKLDLSALETSGFIQEYAKEPELTYEFSKTKIADVV
jgi:hypothetical protein